MLHGEIQERLGSVEGVDAARPPGAVVDEGEPLAQDQQAFAHEVGCEVPENRSVDQVGLGNQTMGIILHLLDLIEQALPGEFLVQRNGSEEPARGTDSCAWTRRLADRNGDLCLSRRSFQTRNNRARASCRAGTRGRVRGAPPKTNRESHSSSLRQSSRT